MAGVLISICTALKIKHGFCKEICLLLEYLPYSIYDSKMLIELLNFYFN